MGLSDFLFSLADVRCEQCQKKFKLLNIKDNEVLVCDACGATKPIAKRGDVPHIEFDRSLVKPSASVNIERRGSIFILEKRWLSRTAKALMVIAGIWNVAWISAFFAVREGYLPFELLQDPIAKKAIIIAGLGLVIFALRAGLNRTRIMIKNSKMVVSTSPIHWGSLAVYDVHQIAGMKLWQNHPKTGQPAFSFRVDMTLKDGRTVTLCPANDSNEAAYIEKTLEEFLTIEQTPIIVDPLVS
jgi:hypothetical protein